MGLIVRELRGGEGSPELEKGLGVRQRPRREHFRGE